MLSGFLIIRWLVKDDYATFTLVLAIQGTAAVLVELGFSSGLLALIGRRFEDVRVAGRYIAAVKFYRSRLLVLGACILALMFYFIGGNYGWSPGLMFVLWASVVSSICYEAKASLYNPILELHQKVKEMYSVDLISSALRLTILGFFYLLNVLSAPVALLVGSFQSIVAAAFSKHYAKSYIELPEADDTIEVEKKELLQLTLPKIAGAVFFAFQGQVTIFLIGIFGQYENIAEIGALNKIGMLFMVPMSFLGMLIVPWFSKQGESQVLRPYLAIMVAYAFVGLGVIGLTLALPGMFLWILGEGYSGLSLELRLYALAAALGTLSKISYLLTACRKWVFYWTAPISITVYIVTLIGFLVFIDLSVIANVIFLSVINSIVLILLHQIVFWVGYRRDKRRIASESAEESL